MAVPGVAAVAARALHRFALSSRLRRLAGSRDDR
jgi:hypothetical protein